MSQQKIVVFGGRGHIGSNVEQALKEEEYVVEQADDTADQGSINTALGGAYGCFLVTTCDFNNPNSEEQEIARGRAIGEMCVRHGVKHVVYCTQMSVVRTIGMKAHHMDGKAEIEHHLKGLGLNVTSIIVPLLYESLLEPPLRPCRMSATCYGIDIPVGEHTLYLMSGRDLGPVVASVLRAPERWGGKTVSVCGDKRLVSELAAILNASCRGVSFQQKHLTIEQWEIDHPCPGNRDYAHMFSFYTRVDQRASIDVTLQLNPATQSFPDWVADHADDVVNALKFPDKPPCDPWACL